MVSTYNWDNPRPLENEEGELELFLRDVGSEGFLPYRTSKEVFEDAMEKVTSSYKTISREDLERHLETVENYCITRVVDAEDSNERRIYFRRMMMTSEILRDLTPDRIEALDEAVERYHTPKQYESIIKKFSKKFGNESLPLHGSHDSGF
tara:strand:- start:1359 stop:1808 length:450 start_codon:yes stop_codon:yes gene_type:complete